MLVLLLLIEDNTKGTVSLDSLVCKIFLLLYLFSSSWRQTTTATETATTPIQPSQHATSDRTSTTPTKNHIHNHQPSDPIPTEHRTDKADHQTNPGAATLTTTETTKKELSATSTEKDSPLQDKTPTKTTHPTQPQPQPQFNVPSTESIMEQIRIHSKQQH